MIFGLQTPHVPWSKYETAEDFEDFALNMGDYSSRVNAWYEGGLLSVELYLKLCENNIALVKEYEAAVATAGHSDELSFHTPEKIAEMEENLRQAWNEYHKEQDVLS